MEYEKILRDFVKMIEQAQVEQRFYTEKLKEAEAKECDILHQIEFGKPSERNKWATQLSRVLQERRFALDKLKLVDAIVKYAEENKPAVKKTEMVLGEVRKNVKLMKNRKYSPRILTNLTMEGLGKPKKKKKVVVEPESMDE